ncbi:MULTISPECIES: Hemin transport protein [Xanthomonas]|uniref:Hemin transport protein n=1 Tax=Xanthomonas dyei TaxID=743699 RepID=A0ABZ0DAJ2_9XANT|nr:Hemin transport protein [Xanthomonas dyei]WOB27300.1 Hemin transport protein [Xanthomonas dyei]WOB54922.1 Hemin transport protein [Xanthomonas dyei]
MPIPRSQPLSSGAGASRAALPRVPQLSALGTVLCLYRPALGNELDGWQHAVDAAVSRQVDSDGVRESIWFFDADGQCCWRLYLLPDSDFLSWDRLVSRLPPLPTETHGLGVGERLWHRLAGRLRGESWRLSALRLQSTANRQQPLVASLATVSALGAEVAARLAREEGIDGRVAADDCCCARAAASRGTDPTEMTTSLLRLRR